ADRRFNREGLDNRCPASQSGIGGDHIFLKGVRVPDLKLHGVENFISMSKIYIFMSLMSKISIATSSVEIQHSRSKIGITHYQMSKTMLSKYGNSADRLRSLLKKTVLSLSRHPLPLRYCYTTLGLE